MCPELYVRLHVQCRLHVCTKSLNGNGNENIGGILVHNDTLEDRKQDGSMNYPWRWLIGEGEGGGRARLGKGLHERCEGERVWWWIRKR